MGRILLIGMALAVGALLLPATARADAYADLDSCSTSERESDWTAVHYYCGLAIDSGQLDDASLALALSNRCLAANNRQQYDEAIADCTRALSINPEDKAAYDNLGNAYRDTGDLDRAIAAFNSAIALDPNLAAAYSDRGNAYADKGEHDLAIADYSRAIALNAFFADAYYNRGLSYADQHQYDQAILDFDQAIGIDAGRSTYYASRALALFRNGDQAHALEDCDTAVRIDPNSANAYVTRGDLRFATGDYDGAIADYDQGLLIDASPLHAYVNRGYAHFVRGTFAAASGDFAVVVESTPTDGYAVLLRSIAGARAGDNVVKTFEEDGARVDLTLWPGPIVQYYLGDLSKDALRQAAEAADQQQSTEHMCDYDVFVGLGAIIFSDPATARGHFERAVVECPADVLNYVIAKAELARAP